jgi:hypothetical protein
MKPLVDLIPAKARKYVYAVLSAAVAVYGLWQASLGDWTQFAVALVTALVGLMATANTSTTPAPVLTTSRGETTISDEGDGVTDPAELVAEPDAT